MGPEGWLVVPIAVVKNVLVLGKKLTTRSFIYSPQKNIGDYRAVSLLFVAGSLKQIRQADRRHCVTIKQKVLLRKTEETEQTEFNTKTKPGTEHD